MPGFVSRFNEYISHNFILASPKKNSIHKAISEKIKTQCPESAFFIFDIQDVIDKHENWSRLLPKVRPFYSVKANNSQMLLEVLAGLGVGFDVVSKSEASQVLVIQSVNPGSDVLYANPIKSLPQLEVAQKMKIDLMTFDNKCELDKHAEYFPDARLILRIRVKDDSNSIQPFGNKYGVPLSNVREILAYAAELKLNVVGVAFHVGCRTSDAFVFEDAIRDASTVFQMAKEEFNFQFTVLNIGGGFSGADWHSGPGNRNLFARIAGSINKSLETYFPDDLYPDLSIIAEPGTYYCASAFYLATQIIGKRIDSEDGTTHAHYYINDGLFGSFFGPLWGYPVEDPNIPLPISPLVDDDEIVKRTKYNSTIWGHTLASLDVVAKDIELPELNCNEWLVFNDMGDYSVSIVTRFCGFEPSPLNYTIDQTKVLLSDMPNNNGIVKILANGNFYMQC